MANLNNNTISISVNGSSPVIVQYITRGDDFQSLHPAVACRHGKFSVRFLKSNFEHCPPGYEPFPGVSKARSLLLSDQFAHERVSPLIAACMSGRLETAQLLLAKCSELKCPADTVGGVNQASSLGMTALMFAAASSNIELVKTLVKNGADLAAKNNLGAQETAITYAAVNDGAFVSR